MRAFSGQAYSGVIMGSTRTSTPHLFSAVIAVGVAATILFAGRLVAIRLERRTVAWTAPQQFQLKNQGMVFQRTAARENSVLPLYGSSELIIGVPNRANKFFQNAPTGFQVSPVGTVGATSLIILQKIAALGSDLRGRRLAVSISPAWFLMPATRVDWYEGNFSLLTASELTFGGTVDVELKRDIASRMLQFPGTLERSPLLEFALRRLSSGNWFDRLIFCASLPLDGRFYDKQGYSRLARQNYYEKMRALARRYNFTLIEFEDHDEDPAFLDAKHTHLTQEGWLFYNRALDDFFHGRVPRS